MTKVTPEQIFSNPDFDVESFIHHVRLYTDYGGRDLVHALCCDPNILLSIIASDDHALAGRQTCYNPELFKKIHEIGIDVWIRSSEAGSNWIGFCLDENTAVYYKNIARQGGSLKVYKEPGAAAKHQILWYADNMRKIGDTAASRPKRSIPGKRPIDHFRKAFTAKLKAIGCLSLGWQNKNWSKPQISFYTKNYDSVGRERVCLHVTQKSPKCVTVSYRKGDMTRCYEFRRIQWVGRRLVLTDDQIIDQAIDKLSHWDSEFKELRNSYRSGYAGL